MMYISIVLARTNPASDIWKVCNKCEYAMYLVDENKSICYSEMEISTYAYTIIKYC